MEKKLLTNHKILNWYNNERLKDNVEIKNHKNELIRTIKSSNISDICEVKKKMTLWERILKVILS